MQPSLPPERAAQVSALLALLTAGLANNPCELLVQCGLGNITSPFPTPSFDGKMELAWLWPIPSHSQSLVAGGVPGEGTVVQDSCDKDAAMGMHRGMLCRTSPSPGQFVVTGLPQPDVGATLGSAHSKTDLAQIEPLFPMLGMLSAARALLLGNPCWLAAQPGTVWTRSQGFALSAGKKKSNQELIPCICICQTFAR